MNASPDQNTAATLPGFEGFSHNAPQAGYVEREVAAQVQALKDIGLLTVHHAGQVALAITTARALDQSSGRGAASGYANLSRAMKEILELLPAPEAKESSLLEAAIEAIMTGIDPRDAATDV